MIPKIIWTYWDSETVPEVIKRCIETWKKYNKNYEIIFLNDITYSNYIDIPNIYYDTIQRKSDFIRIYLLEKYGGVWIDSSTICTAPLDSILDFSHEFIGYYINSFTVELPIIENWFMACEKNSQFMKLAIEEFEYAYSDINSYINNYIVKNNINNPKYLLFHMSILSVLSKYNISKIKLYKAEDGPFKYLAENNWTSVYCLNKICENDDFFTKPIIKLRGSEREILINNTELADCIFSKTNKENFEVIEDSNINNEFIIRLCTILIIILIIIILIVFYWTRKIL